MSPQQTTAHYRITAKLGERLAAFLADNDAGGDRAPDDSWVVGNPEAIHLVGMSSSRRFVYRPNSDAPVCASRADQSGLAEALKERLPILRLNGSHEPKRT